MKKWLPDTAREYEKITHWNGIPLPELPPDVEWFLYAKEPAIREVGLPDDDAWPEHRHGLPYCLNQKEGRTKADASCYNGAQVHPQASVDNLDTDEEALNILAQWFWMGVV